MRKTTSTLIMVIVALLCLIVAAWDRNWIAVILAINWLFTLFILLAYEQKEETGRWS